MSIRHPRNRWRWWVTLGLLLIAYLVWWATRMEQEVAPLLPPKHEYHLTADKLNALYAICQGVKPADVCMNKVRQWLEAFIQ